MNLSVCLIVKNEEIVLARCLSCVKKFADEIVVVDTGSTDKTVEIAKSFTEKVFFMPWQDDFSLARNYAFSKASGEYLMWLDADDIVEDSQIDKIKALKTRLNEADTFMLSYRSGELNYYRERIIKRCDFAVWQGRVHEVITPFGRIKYENIFITHSKQNAGMGGRNLHIYEIMQENREVFSSRDAFYFARELFYHERYEEAIKLFESFLQRADAWCENKISACEHLATCLLKTGEREKAKRTLINGLLYATPRAELLCMLGNIYFEEGNYRQAIFYYRTCLCCEYDEKTGGFCRKDDYGFIPYIQLCVCHSRLCENEIAEQYNELAGRLKPNSQAYLHNLHYFAGLRK